MLDEIKELIEKRARVEERLIEVLGKWDRDVEQFSAVFKTIMDTLKQEEDGKGFDMEDQQEEATDRDVGVSGEDDEGEGDD